MAANNVSALPAGESVLGEVRRHWGWLLALGVLFVILGTVGLGMSVALTVVSVMFFGVLLVIGGAAQLVQAQPDVVAVNRVPGHAASPGRADAIAALVPGPG